MKNTLFLLVLSLFISSCNKDEEKDLGVNVNISSDFNFVPVDASGNNLLKAVPPLTINDFDIVLYDKEGKPYYFYDSMLGHPKRIAIKSKFGDSDWVCIYLNGPKNGKTNISITHLRIGDKVYIVKGEWKTSSDGNFEEVRKVWFDDNLVYNPDEEIGLVNIHIDAK